MRSIGAHRQCLCRVDWGRRTLFCGGICLVWADHTSRFLPPLCPPRCFSLSPYRSADLTLPCLDLLAAGICHLGHARSSSFILRVSRVHVGGGCGKFHASRLSHRATIRHAHASARRTRARAARDRGPAAPPRAARRWSRVQCASSPTWPQPISGADRVRDASLFRCAKHVVPPALHHALVHCRAQTTPHPI